MPPRIPLFRSARSIIPRSQTSTRAKYQPPLYIRILQKRNITADKRPLQEAEKGIGPNQDQLPYISKEAAIEGKITGEGGPELKQSTPIGEVYRYITSIYVFY